MKNYLLILVHVICALVLISAACSETGNSSLKGKWRSTDGKTQLQITGKQFILSEEAEPVAEDYFVKADTIFTSFEGSAPTKFVIQQLDNKNLKLLYPDSLSVAFVR
ncbi:hypothetical protein [Mucilaginibacter aquatilis]|uniref:DUF5640 domain-containing protein n=1 Tax=Mucilaginibacter aquatilis TaxID=1517760 RepID=A0A6I4IQ96_9SPHI|nr:hypothetical protein [Mucilaginibacter aquatilis]MVN90754.1 hypothetical protein [Mucilaginibacter aquatilis]